MASKKITDLTQVPNVDDNDLFIVETTDGTRSVPYSKIKEPIDSNLSEKASLNSPSFTGTPEAPTASPETNSTQIATTGFVHGGIAEHNVSPTSHSDIRELINNVSSTASDAYDQANASNAKVDETVAAHNTSSSAHNDIRELVTELTTRLNALADSDDTTLDQLSEIVAYIKSNRDLIDGVTTGKVNVSDIVDDLTSEDVDKPLSAHQGKVLKGLITALESTVSYDTTAVDAYNQANAAYNQANSAYNLASSAYSNVYTALRKMNDTYVAIGSNSNSNSSGGVAVGWSSNASGSSSIAVGTFTNSIGSYGISLGMRTSTNTINANTQSDGAIAIGYNANASVTTNASKHTTAIAIGSNTKAVTSNVRTMNYDTNDYGGSTIAIGYNVSSPAGYDNTVIGHNVSLNSYTQYRYNQSSMSYETITEDSHNLIVMGYDTVVTGLNSVVIGGSFVNGSSSIAIGTNANYAKNCTLIGAVCQGESVDFPISNTVAIGAGSYEGVAYANGEYSVSIGAAANANSYGSIAIGFGSTASGYNSIALRNANVTGNYSIGIGSVRTKGASNILISASSTCECDHHHCVGIGEEPEDDYSVAIGSAIKCEPNIIAIGNLWGNLYDPYGSGDYQFDGYGTSVTNGVKSLAIGFNASTMYNNAIAIGHNVVSMAEGMVAIGFNCGAYQYNTNNAAINSIAIGTRSYVAQAHDAIAIGDNANAGYNYSVAIGYNAVAAAVNTIQLGDTGTSSLKCKVAITTTSDERDKADITPIGDGATEFLNKIRAIRYVFNSRDLYSYDDSELTDEELEKRHKFGLYGYDKEAHKAGTKKGFRIRVGVSAQETQKALKEVYNDSSYGNIVDDNLFDYDPDEIPDDVESQLSVNYTGFIPFLIKAIQEIDERLTALENK